MKQIRPAIVSVLLMTALTGILYPSAVTGLAQLIFPSQAQGSLIVRDGKVIGSGLIGQNFISDKYFHSRPSATVAADPDNAAKMISAPYNAANSGGSNLGPTNKAFVDNVKNITAALHAENNRLVPVDLVTASGSGLDPDITPAAAQFQVSRVAKARNLPESRIASLVVQYTQNRVLDFIGEPRVNVLKLNLALDDLKPAQ